MADTTQTTPASTLQAAWNGIAAPFIYLAGFIPRGWMKWIALLIMGLGGIYFVRSYLMDFRIPTWGSGVTQVDLKKPTPTVADKTVAPAKVTNIVTLDQFNELQARVANLESRQTGGIKTKKVKVLRDPKD